MTAGGESFIDRPVEENRPPAVRLGALWFGLLGAPIAWTVQELADYPLVAHNCFPADVPLRQPTLAPLHAIVLVVSALAIVLAALALTTSWISWRRSGGHFGAHRSPLLEDAPPAGRVRFMALAGICVSAVFALGIVFHTISALMLAPCK